MTPTAIVYTSNTGYTAAYAKILSEKTGLPVYSLLEADKKLEAGTEIIYLGWLMASIVKDYKKAYKKYKVCAVCGVGLCDTGALLDEARQSNAIPENIPLFTLQGGMDHNRLKGMYKFVIKMLTKAIAKKQERSEEEDRMLYLLENGGNYVSEENLSAVLEWYSSIK